MATIMNLGRARGVSSAIVGLLVLGAAGWPAEVAGSARRVATCATAQLSVVLRFGPGSGSAGHFTGALLFDNRSSAACTLRGYPGVSFTDAHGHRLGLAADRASGRVRTVTVAPRTTVGAQLTLVDVDVYDRTACRPTAAAAVRVFAPSQRRALSTRHTLRVCRGREHDASIGPVVTRPQLIPGTF